MTLHALPKITQQPLQRPALTHPQPATTLRSLLWLALAAAAAAPVLADEKLARTNACIACHTVERKIVGPSFKDIAKRRAGEAGAAELLADHIRHGSKGVYGAVPMPPNPRVSEADAAQLAEWILGLHEEASR